jgi:hypothetical protein
MWPECLTYRLVASHSCCAQEYLAFVAFARRLWRPQAIRAALTPFYTALRKSQPDFAIFFAFSVQFFDTISTRLFITAS